MTRHRTWFALLLLIAPAVASAEDDVKFGPLKAAPPAGWKAFPSDDPEVVRAFRLEPALNDKYPTTVTANRLPKRDTAEAFVKHWAGQFVPTEDVAPKDFGKPTTFEVAETKVTYLDIRGVFRPDPKNTASIRSDTRILAAYFDTKDGPYAIRILGPASSVESYRKEFLAWVKAFH